MFFGVSMLIDPSCESAIPAEVTAAAVAGTPPPPPAPRARAPLAGGVAQKIKTNKQRYKQTNKQNIQTNK